MKSPVIHNYTEYRDWMFKHGHWINHSYVQPEHERPNDFPLIVINEYYMDYDRRYRNHTYHVFMSDFDEDKVD